MTQGYTQKPREMKPLSPSTWHEIALDKAPRQSTTRSPKRYAVAEALKRCTKSSDREDEGGSMHEDSARPLGDELREWFWVSVGLLGFSQSTNCPTSECTCGVREEDRVHAMANLNLGVFYLQGQEIMSWCRTRVVHVNDGSRSAGCQEVQHFVRLSCSSMYQENHGLISRNMQVERT